MALRKTHNETKKNPTSPPAETNQLAMHKQSQRVEWTGDYIGVKNKSDFAVELGQPLRSHMLPTYKQTLEDYLFQISNSRLLQFALSRNTLNSEALLVDTLTSEWLDFLIKTCHFHKTLPQFLNKLCMFTFPCL